MGSKAKTLPEYFESVPAEAKEKLEEIRTILKGIAPEATETIKWGVPVLEQERILFSYSASKSYITFMPTRSTLEVFEDDLKEYTTGKDTVQFTFDKPLPVALIKKLAHYRMKEVKEGALWKHND